MRTQIDIETFSVAALKMALQAMLRRIGTLRLPNYRGQTLTRRTLIPAPRSNSGPLMERRADRELPAVNTDRRWMRTLPIFAVVVGAAMLGIFNYQKSSSSVVSSTLYALRTSPRAREILGDEIYFAQKIPWISGEMNQLHGRIDISFWVKGTKSQGKMKFRSIRPNRMSYFHTEEWSLETEDGTVIQLLDKGNDPFHQSH
ncbi:cytochrome c oxidase assembly factor 1 family protein [Aspergillus tanneri]|uniref:DUF1783-domain-containing protein n=1 Tax=Aspergillus tanneri TaxID=1220188 RepID=A0A5M9MV04_9EURO|nr:uncharacterized protein ATNIH1004_005119 [Aspergillus tanneri]KAA8649224.1 hypothetical protein ATNIH1004_005119 [Aspergillus tanneri]